VVYSRSSSPAPHVFSLCFVIPLLTSVGRSARSSLVAGSGAGCATLTVSAIGLLPFGQGLGDLLGGWFRGLLPFFYGFTIGILPYHGTCVKGSPRSKEFLWDICLDRPVAML
jgi:hypothetical protein